MKAIKTKMIDKAGRLTTSLWFKFLRLRRWETTFAVNHGSKCVLAAFGVWFILTVLRSDVLIAYINPFFKEDDDFKALKSSLSTLGAALIGATTVAFSFVQFALQANIDRLPHGLFQRFSSDRKLFLAFGTSFFLALLITSLSIIKQPEHAGMMVLITSWCFIIGFSCMLYSYKRALFLINPGQQIGLIVKEATADLECWGKRAGRLSKYAFIPPDLARRHDNIDYRRALVLRKNPDWDQPARIAIDHCIVFARKYAERGDYEISKFALAGMAAINAGYIRAKGRTFLQDNPFLFISSTATEGFINATLEHLRQTIAIAATRRDERLLIDCMQCLETLFVLYCSIEYSRNYDGKQHANLAAGYLKGAAETVMALGMADVMMECARLVGNCVIASMALQPEKVSMTLEILTTLAVAGLAREETWPVTLTAVQQISKGSVACFGSKNRVPESASEAFAKAIQTVGLISMNLPDNGLRQQHKNTLAPYFSTSAFDSLPATFSEVGNLILPRPENDNQGGIVLSNLEKWVEAHLQLMKQLFTVAVNKQSSFGFDAIHFPLQLYKILLILYQARAGTEYVKEQLLEHARSIIYMFSFLPDNEEAVAFASNYSLTEALARMAKLAVELGRGELIEASQNQLFRWMFQTSKFRDSRGEFAAVLSYLAVLCVTQGTLINASILRTKLLAGLARNQVPPETRIRAAQMIERDLREPQYGIRFIEQIMARADQTQLEAVLREIIATLREPPATQAEAPEPPAVNLSIYTADSVR